MKIYNIERLEHNALPELITTATLEIPIQLASLLVMELGEHSYSYLDRRYWYARIDNAVIYRGITLLTRGDGTAAIIYRHGDEYTLELLERLIGELVGIHVALTIVHVPIPARTR